MSLKKNCTQAYLHGFDMHGMCGQGVYIGSFPHYKTVKSGITTISKFADGFLIAVYRSCSLFTLGVLSAELTNLV